jgi:undecaprenyl-diphosphatase
MAVSPAPRSAVSGLIAPMMAAAAVAALLCWAWVDRPVAEWMLQRRDWDLHRISSNLLTPVVRNGMYVVDVLVLLLGGALLKRREWVQAGGLGLASLGVGAILSQTLKVLVHRPRPGVLAAGVEPSWGLYWSSREWHSFPSGDVTAMCAIGAAWALALASSELRSLAFGPALLVAVGRIVAGRHFVSDCLAGVVVGCAAALIVWAAWRRLRGPQDRPPDPPVARVDSARTG